MRCASFVSKPIPRPLAPWIFLCLPVLPRRRKSVFRDDRHLGYAFGVIERPFSYDQRKTTQLSSGKEKKKVFGPPA